MDKLKQITTLLKDNGINEVARQLKMKKPDIYNFLKSNGLVYTDGEVKPIIDINKEEVAITNDIQNDKPSNNRSVQDIIQSLNKNIDNKKVTKVIPKDKPSQSIIQKYNKNIDINKLNELIEMIEPLKEIIQEYNKSKNIIEIEKVELNPRSITEVKQKLFKVDIEVLKNWEKFVAEHKQYKIQNLVSMALEEFIDKYK